MPRHPAFSSAIEGIHTSVFAALEPAIRRARDAGRVLVPFQIGDTALPPPACVHDVRFDVQRDVPYGGIHGRVSLRAAIAARHARAGAAVEPSEVLLGVGATHALSSAFHALLSPADEVILAAPFWPLIRGVVRAAGGVTREWPITPRLRGLAPRAVAEELTSLVGPATVAVYVTSPNNPDGTVWTQEALGAVANAAKRHNLWIIADEVYADFAFERAHTSMRELAPERTVVAGSFSKSHGLAGLRVGYVVAPKDVVSRAQRVVNHTVYNVPEFAQETAQRSLEQGSAWIAAARVTYRETRDAMVKALRSEGFTVDVPDGGAYCFVDFSTHLGKRTMNEFLEHAIEEGVLIAPGIAFGEAFASWGRLCFTGTSTEAMQQGIRALGRAARRV